MVPIGWRLAAPEVAYILKDTGAKLLFVEEQFSDCAEKACADLPAKPAILEEAATRMAMAKPAQSRQRSRSRMEFL